MKVRNKWWWPFPVASMLGSSCAVVFGQDVYGKGDRKFIRWACRWLYAGDKLVWQAKYRLIKRHRYHLVDTGLRPGYHDEDERMLWACMSVLGDYMRFHGGPEKLEAFTADLASEPVDWRRDMTRSQEAHQDEAVSIWRWWKTERPANRKLHGNMVCAVYAGRELKFTPLPGGELSEMTVEEKPDAPPCEWTGEDCWEMESKLNADDQAMLHRLIDIRPGLWT